MKNVHYEIILQSLTEDLLRRDAKIKDLSRRYDKLKSVHAADIHCPIQLSSSDRKAIREHLYWQLKHYKHEEKRKK